MINLIKEWLMDLIIINNLILGYCYCIFFKYQLNKTGFSISNRSTYKEESMKTRKKYNSLFKRIYSIADVFSIKMLPFLLLLIKNIFQMLVRSLHFELAHFEFCGRSFGPTGNSGTGSLGGDQGSQISISRLHAWLFRTYIMQLVAYSTVYDLHTYVLYNI